MFGCFPDMYKAAEMNGNKIKCHLRVPLRLRRAKSERNEQTWNCKPFRWGGEILCGFFYSVSLPTWFETAPTANTF